jgi:hypothetical protein
MILVKRILPSRVQALQDFQLAFVEFRLCNLDFQLYSRTCHGLVETWRSSFTKGDNEGIYNLFCEASCVEETGFSSTQDRSRTVHIILPFIMSHYILMTTRPNRNHLHLSSMYGTIAHLVERQREGRQHQRPRQQ